MTTLKTSTARNTGNGIGRALSLPALAKKNKIKNLSKKIRKKGATPEDIEKLKQLKSA